MKINDVLRVSRSEGYHEILKKIKNKIKTKCYGYKLDLSNYNYEGNNEYLITLLNNELLEKMYCEYKDEIDEVKYNILKNKVNNKYYECYVSLSMNNEICGFLNLAYKDIEDKCINTTVKVRDNTVYLFDGYTFESHRKKGALSYLSNSMLQSVKDKGYKYALVNIIDGIKASEKEAYKAGFKRYIRYNYYHIGLIKKTYKQYYSGVNYVRK